MPLPRPWPLAGTLLPLLLLPGLMLSAGGCGLGGAQDRPIIVATLPPNGGSVASPQASFRVTYDDPVRLFATNQFLVRRDGVGIPVVVFQLPTEPDSVRVGPSGAPGFAPGVYDVYVSQGLVLNDDDHYMLDEFQFRVTVTEGDASLFAAAPAARTVTELDPFALSVRSQATGAAGQVPQAVTAIRHGLVTHVVVQLTDGGGTGAALARYVAGAPVFTPLALSTSGGDLLAPRPALLLAPEGDVAYAAFRDVAAQQVRLARVRVADGVETGSLLLSPPADASCFPTALEVVEKGKQLLVVVERAGAAQICRVDRATFAEIDHDGGAAGIQCWQPGGAAGPAEALGALLYLAPDGAVTADAALLDLSLDTLTPAPSTVPGTTRAVAATLSGSHVLFALAGGTPDEHLSVRTAEDPLVDAPFALSDDVGGVDQGASEVHDVSATGLGAWVLLDQDLLIRLVRVGPDLAQFDGDALFPGTQAFPLPAAAAGSTRLGALVGILE